MNKTIKMLSFLVLACCFSVTASMAVTVDWSKVSDADVDTKVTSVINDLSKDGWTDQDKEDLKKLAEDAADNYADRPQIARKLLSIVHASHNSHRSLVIESFLARLNQQQVSDILRDTFGVSTDAYVDALADMFVLVGNNNNNNGNRPGGNNSGNAFGNNKPDNTGASGSGNNNDDDNNDDDNNDNNNNNNNNNNTSGGETTPPVAPDYP